MVAAWGGFIVPGGGLVSRDVLSCNTSVSCFDAANYSLAASLRCPPAFWLDPGYSASRGGVTVTTGGA